MLYLEAYVLLVLQNLGGRTQEEPTVEGPRGGEGGVEIAANACRRQRINDEENRISWASASAFGSSNSLGKCVQCPPSVSPSVYTL